MFEHTIMNCHNTAHQVKYRSPIPITLDCKKRQMKNEEKSPVGSPTLKRDGKS
jgi:hypothetical protein